MQNAGETHNLPTGVTSWRRHPGEGPGPRHGEATPTPRHPFDIDCVPRTRARLSALDALYLLGAPQGEPAFPSSRPRRYRDWREDRVRQPRHLCGPSTANAVNESGSDRPNRPATSQRRDVGACSPTTALVRSKEKRGARAEGFRRRPFTGKSASCRRKKGSTDAPTEC